jgi:hypothetical protein
MTRFRFLSRPGLGLLWGIGVLFQAGLVQAQTAPDGQVLGPAWVGTALTVRGTVIATQGLCRQIAVDDVRGIPGAGGRAWGCWSAPSVAPALGAVVQIQGQVTRTQMTRLGARWRVVPVIEGL